MITLNASKRFLEYDMKDLRKVKTIIPWQIDRDTAAGTIRIHRSAFIRDLVIEKELNDCNANVIQMKAGSSIKMTDAEDYEAADLCTD